MNITRRQFLASSSALGLLAAIPLASILAEPEIVSAAITHGPRAWYVDPTAFYLGKEHNNGTSWGSSAQSLADIADQIKPTDTVFVCNTHFDYVDVFVPPNKAVTFQNCKFGAGPVAA